MALLSTVEALESLEALLGKRVQQRARWGREVNKRADSRVATRRHNRQAGTFERSVFSFVSSRWSCYRFRYVALPVPELSPIGRTRPSSEWARSFEEQISISVDYPESIQLRLSYSMQGVAGCEGFHSS